MITEKDLQVCILRKFVDFTNVVRSIYFCQFVRQYGTSAKDYTNIDIKFFWMLYNGTYNGQMSVVTLGDKVCSI